MKKLNSACAAIVSAFVAGLILPGTAIADPPAHAPAHGWRAKNDPYYVGYTGRHWTDDYGIRGEHCDGFDELVGHLHGVDADALLEQTGLRSSEIDAFAQMVASSEKIIICWAMGLTQHKAAVPTIREIVNTLLLRGKDRRMGRGYAKLRNWKKAIVTLKAGDEIQFFDEQTS